MASPVSSRRRPSIRTCPGAGTSSCSPRSTATGPGSGSVPLSRPSVTSARERAPAGGEAEGRRRRRGHGGALGRERKLLLLDEPATGLDPAGMRDMRLLIRRLADEGMTVVLSSHLLAEVEELCNRVAIVRSG